MDLETQNMTQIRQAVNNKIHICGRLDIIDIIDVWCQQHVTVLVDACSEMGGT